MTKFLSLLTNVSNNSVPIWAHGAIQASMWIAVISQIFLLVPDMINVIRTRDTRENRWFKWIVWFVCSAAWICYSMFLIWENIPIEESIGLAVSEGANLICLFIIYGIKIKNIRMAKHLNITEKQWCSLLNSIYVAKKALSKPIKKGLAKACKHLTPKEKFQLYIEVLKTYRVAYKVKRTITKTAKKVAKGIIRTAKQKRD